MHDYPEMTLAREDMKLQSELYRPTAFWDDASAGIVAEINELGIERFRALPLALRFFVPTYGGPGGGLSVEQVTQLDGWLRSELSSSPKAQLALQQFTSGKLSALADFRVLSAADDRQRLPRLHTFSESTVGSPIEQFEFEGRRFSRSSLNYLLGLALLKKHLVSAPPRRVLEIGGGFGTLGEVLAQAGIDDLHYIDIDIPPTSSVAQFYLTSVLGADRVAAYANTRDRSSVEIDALPTATVLNSWQIEKLTGKIDLFVNFISFQEMEPEVVRNYLSHVRRLGADWVLLRNLREGQRLRVGSNFGVETPIVSDDYLAMLPEYELVERNVVPFGFQAVDGYHSELQLLKRATR